MIGVDAEAGTDAPGAGEAAEPVVGAAIFEVLASSRSSVDGELDVDIDLPRTKSPAE